MHLIRHVFFLLVAWHTHFNCSGQTGEMIFQHLGVQEGLSQATNAFINKDSRGFVWISSLTGLNRFDGTQVKVYTPDKSDPSSIMGENIQSSFFEDQNRDLWFCTFDAINKYNLADDCFDHYQVWKDSITPEIGYYIFYLDTDQQLWFLVDGQLLYTFHIPTGTFHYKGKVRIDSVRCFVSTTASGKVSKLFLRGRDWPGIEVIDINDAQEIEAQYPLSQSSAINVNHIRKIIFDHDSVGWILTPFSFVRYSFKTGEETVFPISGGSDMINLSDSVFFIGTEDNGLIQFNAAEWERTSGRLGLTKPPSNSQENKISYITKDRDGTIWISTDGIGVKYAHPEKGKFETIYFSDYLSGEKEIIPVNLFEDQPGRILYFTRGDGVFELIKDAQPKVIRPFSALKQLETFKTQSVSRDVNGYYWVCTWSGIYVYFPEKGLVRQVTDSLLIALTSHATMDGKVLITTSEKGVYEGKANNDGTVQISFIPKIPSEENYFPVMQDAKGRIWLNEDLQAIKIFEPSSYRPLDTILLNTRIEAMVNSQDGRTIWLATSTGLYEIDDASLVIRMVHSEHSGFPATSFTNMLMDNSGKLWLGHYNGIVSYDPISKVTRTFSREDGLPPYEYTNAACKLKNGEIWLGSIGGVTRFFPDSIKELLVPAIPQISDLLINDKPNGYQPVCQVTGATHLPAIEKLVLDYRYNTLSFRLHALEYSAPKSNTLRYTMEELDDGYIQTKNGSTIRYSNIPPGNYRFVVYAHNSDGVENPNPRILHLVIKSPYYETWWFRSLTAILIFSIVAYIIYLRFSKKLELQNIRLKLYENLHDDVGSRLTAIVLSAEELEQNEQITHPKIKAISKIARSIVGNMRRLVWAIDPENDRMTSIVQKINHDKSLILDDQIAFSIEVDERLKNIVLPGEIRYQISSVCNEAFTNIAKYAQASKVSVQITRENKSIKLMVTDDGKGFDPEEKRKNTLQGSGYGMSNMQRRASRAGGVFKVHSSPGQGTRIEFQFPFHVKSPKKI